MRCLRLPFYFDPIRLSADLARVRPEEWIPHMNRHDYEGRWSGAALRSVAGEAGNIVPEARGLERWRETALLQRCPYFQEVIGTLACPLQAVRLLRLHAGSRIAEHVDRALDFEEGEVRIHVPVATSEQVFFYIDGARLVLNPGECWYTNVNLPHSVENRGETARIHLVIDCVVDDWLRALFATTPRPAPDYYAADLRLPAGSNSAGWIPPLAEAAARLSRPGHPVRFRSEGAVFILHWSGTHAWQLRFRQGEDGAAELESSPDAERHHERDYVELLGLVRAAFPAVQINEKGLTSTAMAGVTR